MWKARPQLPSKRQVCEQASEAGQSADGNEAGIREQLAPPTEQPASQGERGHDHLTCCARLPAHLFFHSACERDLSLMKELAEVSGQGALGVSSCPHPPHPSSVDKLHGSHVEKFSGNRVLFPTSLLVRLGPDRQGQSW